jgi:uncharacterized protein (DUF2267 family)
LSWEDEEKAYLALKATLQQLRNRLTVREAADLSSRLPMLLRGMFLEGWITEDPPMKFYKEEYLDLVRGYFQNNPDLDVEKTLRAVFELLLNKISDGEIQDIKGILPEDMKELLP